MVKKYFKYISIMLAGVFCMHILFPALILIGIQNIKHLQHELISQNKNHLTLKRFEVTEKEFKEITFSSEKEIIRNNTWYDVAYSKKENNKCVVYALCDEKETQLVQINTADVNKNTQPTNHTSKVILLSFLYFQNSIQTVTLQTDIAKYFSFTIHFALANPFIKIASPPPDFC